MKLKRGLVTLSISVLITLTATQTFATPGEVLRERQQGIQGRMNTTNQLLQSSRRESDQLNQQIRQINEKVNQAKSELHNVRVKLEQFIKDIEITTEELEEAQEKLDENTDMFNQRLRKMYKNGNAGYIEVLLSSDDLSDFLSRNHMIQQIVGSDKELIAFIKEQRDIIELKKKELEEQKEAIEAAKAEIEVRKAQLEEANQEKQVMMARLQRDIANYESEYASLRNSSRQIDSQIASLQAPTRGNSTTRTATTNSESSNSTTTPSSNSPAPTTPSSNSPAPTTPSSNSPAPSAPKETVKAPTPSSGRGVQVAALARQFLGHRYVYGGTTPNGFDCSGFTQYIYRQFGVNLPRSSGAQRSAGTAVSRANIQPGDLLTFPGHVGIYVGNGVMVHASNPTRGVVTDNVFSGYYNGRLLSIRRIVN